MVGRAALALCVAAATARAQEPLPVNPDAVPAPADVVAPVPVPEAPSAPGLQPTPGTLIVVPAMTPVYIRLEEPISSNINKPGDHFRISIAEDVRVGDAVVIAAGAEGVGEVVYAARSGGGGKAGELILAARLVHVGDQDVRLRSFAMGIAGRDRSGEALATSIIAGPFAMFVHGGAVVIPPDTLASAKTAEAVQLPALPAAPPPPAELPPETTTEGRLDEKQTS